VVTLALAKEHCRIDDTASDTILQQYLDAATGIVEARTGLALSARSVVQEYTEFGDYIDPPLKPVNTVTTIEYLDTVGASQTFTTFRVVDDKIYPNYGLNWPSLGNPAGITLTYTTTANDIDELNSAILLLVGHYYENREAVAAQPGTELPLAVDALLDKYTNRWIA